MWEQYGRLPNLSKLSEAKLNLLAFQLTRFAKMVPEKGSSPEVEAQIYEALRKGDIGTFHRLYKENSEKNEQWRKWKDELEHKMLDALKSQDFNKFSEVFDHLNPVLC